MMQTLVAIMDAKRDKFSGWEALCVWQFGIAERTADRFIAVAQDEGFGAHAFRIPPSWNTLNELDKLDDETFHRAIECDDICPDREHHGASSPLTLYTIVTL